MQLISKENKINIEKLKEIAKEKFGNLIKAVVDVEREIMVIGGDLHTDEEAFLLNNGSKQENLWGINLYPENYSQEDWIEFDSMINLRPSWGNNSRGVDDPKTREKIIQIVNNLIIRQ